MVEMRGDGSLMGGPNHAGPPGGYAFTEFVRQVAPWLVAGGHVRKTMETLHLGDFAVDLVVESPAGATYVEVLTNTPSTKHRLEASVQRLDDYVTLIGGHPLAAAAVAFPGVLSDERFALLEANNIGVWDGPTLVAAAQAASIPVPPDLGIRGSRLSLQKPADYQLHRRLSRIKPGRDDWSRYQTFARDLLEYLFTPQLSNAYFENATENKVNRRDIILPNYADTGFWESLRRQYRADFVVVDAKNSGALIRKADVLQLANYLSPYGAGLFGMVLARKGADKGAAATIREQWIIHQKLILVLTDDDVRQMIAAKAADDDPSDLIRQRIEDFRLGL